VSTSWSASDLADIDAADELEIAVVRADGTLMRWTPIWVVCAGDEVYVRSWHRRDTGWFGRAVRTRRASVRVPGLEADVTVEDLADSSAEVTEAVDAAYREKYGSGAGSMVTPEAHATTLRLDRVPGL
jgi:hypothetical protein